MSLNFYEETDPSFARKENLAQRAGWAVMALILILAVVGLFGGGPISRATANHSENGNEIKLTYPRFGRAESLLRMTLEVSAAGEPGSQLSVLLSGEFLDKVGNLSIWPEPDTQAVNGDAIVYAWSVESWAAPQVIAFEYELRDWRQIGGRFEVIAGDQALGGVDFKQFVFP